MIPGHVVGIEARKLTRSAVTRVATATALILAPATSAGGYAAATLAPDTQVGTKAAGLMTTVGWSGLTGLAAMGTGVTILLAAGIVAIAAGIGQAVADPGEPLQVDNAILLFGGTMLYLVTFAFTRWRLFQTLAVPRLSAAAAVLILFFLSTQVAAIYSVALLAVALITLNMVESVVLPRTLRKPGAVG